MLRSSLFAASAVLLSTAAFAQNDASSKLRPVTSPVKNAGTYHLATGTWTRAKAPTAHLGPDALYAKADEALYRAKQKGRDRVQVSTYDQQSQDLA